MNKNLTTFRNDHIIRLNWIRFDGIGIDGIRLNRIRFDRIGLNWIRFNRSGVDREGRDRSGVSPAAWRRYAAAYRRGQGQVPQAFFGAKLGSEALCALQGALDAIAQGAP